MKRSSILEQNYGLSPYKNVYFLALFKSSFSGLKIIPFYVKYKKNHLFWLDYTNKANWKEMRFLDKNHGLSP